MSGIVVRINWGAWWAPPIRWSGIKTKRKPPCDECVLATHAHHGAAEYRAAHPIKRAAWRRTSGEGCVTVLCVDHRFAWLAADAERTGHEAPATWTARNRDVR